jgi:hypothetical protein
MSLRGRGNPGQGSGPPKYPGSFLLAFREAAAGLGWQMGRLAQDVAHCTDAEGEERSVGLENLYRRAKRTPREEWPELIADFLRTINDAEDEGPPENLEAAVEHLMFRLGRPLHIEGDDAKVWSQELPGTDLVVNLVIDYPNRMCYVTQKLVESSGKSGDHWLERAKVNLLERTPADCFLTIHEDSGLRMCSAADAYDSSRALILDRLLPESNVAGNLVVLPGRDELLVLPITMKAVPHLHLMKVLADKNYKNAPYPISDEVYWVYQGVWRRFPVEMKAGAVNVYPPPEFMEMLNGLSGEEKSQGETERQGEGETEGEGEPPG